MPSPTILSSSTTLRTLHQGDKGGDVKRLQQFLAGRGFAIVADGQFGSLTTAAVIDYQRKKGLTADGWVGRQTMLALITDGLDIITDRSEGSDWPPVPDTLTPITSNERRQALFGRFAYRPAPEPGNPEAIQIIDDWDTRHIVRVQIPALRHRHPGAIPLHVAVVDDFQAFFAAIEREGLIKHIETFDGSWCPRFIRGSRQTLSAHAWGTAIDLNADTNGLGCTPAARGTLASLREIAALAPEFRIFWGGWFKQRKDGMHFEHVGH